VNSGEVSEHRNAGIPDRVGIVIYYKLIVNLICNIIILASFCYCVSSPTVISAIYKTKNIFIKFYRNVIRQ